LKIRLIFEILDYTNFNAKSSNYIDLEAESSASATFKSTAIEPSNEIVFESETQPVDMTIPSTADVTCIMPSALPMTRLNPFHKARTPLNDSSKSIINELEEKINSSAKAAKEKDSWKPTPTRKLTKSKVSNGTPSNSINSFFGK
jgi:hypothetical protein